jgi:hypothetical protein
MSLTNTFVEIRRLARDETCFLSVVKLKTTTLAWWPNDGSVIPLDIHDHDRLAPDETSYTPTNPLSIILLFWVPLFLQIRISCFLGGSLREASRKFIHRILSFT